MPRFSKTHIAIALGFIAVVAVWAFWWRDMVSIRVDVPRNPSARVFLSVEARYRDGMRYEERPVFSGYVLANERQKFQLPAAWPWRFDSLRIHVFHPAIRWFDAEERNNPHWARAFVTVSPPLLAQRPDGDSISVSEVERHFEQIDEFYTAKLGIRQTAEQAWPYLDRLRALTTAAGFRKEAGPRLDAQGKADRLQRLQTQWLRLESQLRSAEYLPCEKADATFVNEVPGVRPGCGQRALLSIR